MTTIVFDGTTLAADTMTTLGGWVQAKAVTKMWKGKWFDGRTVLVGFCGDYHFCVAAMRALADGKAQADMPDFTKYDVEKSTNIGLLVDSDKNVYTVTPRFDLIPQDEVIFALGSGAEVAWGALEAGVSAKRAVQIAAKRSRGTGFEVQEFRFSDTQDELDN
jgi:ATP-dependent protease HslVU (ClpYQ) peptidase subunit